LPRPDDSEIDLFFIDTEGTDSEDSDRVAMSVLPILGSVADVRLCVMEKRFHASDTSDFLNGIKAASFLSSVRPTSIAVILRQCGPPNSAPDDARHHNKRAAEDRQFTEQLRATATRVDMTHLFQPDQSRFAGFCQPCWLDDPNEHRSSMTDLARFVVRGAVATHPVGIGWIVSTIRKVSSEISRRTGGDGIINETDNWNSRLGAPCSDAEQEATTKYCREALAKLSCLPDLKAVLRLDVVPTRDAMFSAARQEFRSKCVGEQADLLQLIPGLIRAAEHRLREAIEGHLQRYRTELSHILTKQNEILEAAMHESANAIKRLSDQQVPVFDVIGVQYTLGGRLAQRFLSEVQENEGAERDFPERIQECAREIRRSVKRHLHLQHAARVEARCAANVQGVVREMFPVGTVLAIIGDKKPPWMNANWKRLEPGRVLVSSGEGTGFAVEAKGGQAEHNHATRPHVLTIEETPRHRHVTQSVLPQPYDHGLLHTYNQGSCVGDCYTNWVGGGCGHDHGQTTCSSNYPPYICAVFWRRVA
jgi:ribosomal protein L35